MSNVRNIVLTKRSRDALSKKTENTIFGNVAEEIESGDWYVPGDETKYSRLRDSLVDSFRNFFSLSEEDPIEIKRFHSDILSFCDGIHPDYTTEEGDPDYEILSGIWKDDDDEG